MGHLNSALKTNDEMELKTLTEAVFLCFFLWRKRMSPFLRRVLLKNLPEKFEPHATQVTMSATAYHERPNAYPAYPE